MARCRCNVCGQRFWSLAKMERHRLTAHPQAKPLRRPQADALRTTSAVPVAPVRRTEDVYDSGRVPIDVTPVSLGVPHDPFVGGGGESGGGGATGSWDPPAEPTPEPETEMTPETSSEVSSSPDSSADTDSDRKSTRLN